MQRCALEKPLQLSISQKMHFKKILVLTFKPAVETAWDEDLFTHVDFVDWQFISRNSLTTYEKADKTKPIVCFGSFQDYLGTNENGGIKVKNEWVHSTNWDIVIFDEYHFGAWRENAKKLFEMEDEDSYDSLDIEKYKKEEADNAFNESFLPITSERYLYLSEPRLEQLIQVNLLKIKSIIGLIQMSKGQKLTG